MTSSTSSETQQDSMLNQAQSMGLRRWGLETLTGVLGFKALRNHQARQDKNLTAEDAAVRRQLWGSKETAAAGDEMGDQIVLGNLTHPTPVIIQQPAPQSSGLGKVIAGAALGAAILGIPGAGIAGFFINQLMSQPTVTTEPAPVTANPGETVDIGLLRLTDLVAPQ